MSGSLDVDDSLAQFGTKSRLSSSHPISTILRMRVCTHRAIAIGYSSMAFAKVPGRSKQLPNALVLLILFLEKRGLLIFPWPLVHMAAYRGIDTEMEMLIAAKDHRRAQAARA